MADVQDKQTSKYFADQMDDELAARDLSLARKGAALVGERRKVAAMMVADILSKPYQKAMLLKSTQWYRHVNFAVSFSAMNRMSEP